MKKHLFFWMVLLLQVQSCKQKPADPSKEEINEIDLKRGQIISCGAGDEEFGSAVFEITGNEKIKKDFNLAINLLHSFEYDEAEKAFTSVIDKEPGCAMAYWGVAMSNFHPLWAPPTEPELLKGERVLQIAQSLPASKRETDYIAAIGLFYHDWQHTSHSVRCTNFEKAMEAIYKNYPDDKEAAVFYALSLDAAADPTDKTYSKQKKAGQILQALYANNPAHPGIAHYIIHTYDYPELAQQGLDAARRYASIAPSSAHALHMPSHIFTRLGLWDECIHSNLASVSSAQCYAQTAGIKGHWDEELHGLDYLVYAYLQKNEKDSAKKWWDYLKTIDVVSPVNFKVVYAFAAIPSRYVLENKLWKEAAALVVTPKNFVWQNFPWQESIIRFTRLMGAVQTNNLPAAKAELIILKKNYDTLISQKDQYKANQVLVQAKTGEAWILMKEGENAEALSLMQAAADMEDLTGKHPVTPGEVIPAREFLGDMLMELHLFDKASAAYEMDLKKCPNRFNALVGAKAAAEKTGNVEKTSAYEQQLKNVTGNKN